MTTVPGRYSFADNPAAPVLHSRTGIPVASFDFYRCECAQALAALALALSLGCGDGKLEVLHVPDALPVQAAGGAGGAGGAPEPACTELADCNDGLACTFDECLANGSCAHLTTGCDYSLETEELSTVAEFITTDYQLLTDNTYTPLSSDGTDAYFAWVDGEFRPQVTQLTGSQAITARLDPQDDYQVRNDGVHKFSLGLDRDGYVHVTGDMHHHPASNTDHLPQRYLESQILYWVSAAPRDVTSFTFVGSDPARAIPGYGFSYGSFHVAPDGTLYYLTRVRVHELGHYPGEIGLALYRYAPQSRSWTALGALPPSEPPAQYPCILWEDNAEDGVFFQGLRASLRFDRQGRMHLAATLNNDSTVASPTHVVYAASDDGGDTFLHADGLPIATLPLRVDEGSGTLDIVAGPYADLDLFASAFYDGNSVPAVVYSHNTPELAGYYGYYQPETNSWSGELPSPVGGLIREKHHVDRLGILTFVAQSGRMLRTRGFDLPGVEHTATYEGQGIWIHSIDELGLRRDDVWRAVFELRDTPGMGILRLEWSQQP